MITFLILIVFSGSVYSLNSVFIRQDTPEFPVLTCTISGLNSDKFSTHLYCPLTKSRMCYTNCTKECKFSNGKCNALAGLEAIYSCQYTYFSSDHIQIQFFINSDSLNNNKGEWYCSYAGVNSKGIILTSTKNDRKTISQNNINENGPSKKERRNMEVIATPSVIRVLQITDEIKKINIPAKKTKDGENKQTVQSNDDISFKTFITKFPVVIGILCLFIISVILNIIFCIRDSMIKYYIDNIKNNVRSNKALLFCVCQSDPVTTGKFNPMLSKEADFYRDDYNFSRSNIYEFDSQVPLIMQQRNYSNSVRPSPNISRSRSFQHGSPLLPQVQFDPNYMSMPRAHSQYSPFNYGQHNYPHYGPPGSISLNGSETTREDVIREGQYQFDREGKPILVKLTPNNVVSKPQNIDLINDCDQTNISQSTLDLSKNED